MAPLNNRIKFVEKDINPYIILKLNLFQFNTYFMNI